MKTILVPTDFSANAENAATYAAELALLAKAKLVLLNVYSVPLPVADVPVTMIPIDELEAQCMADLKSLQNKIALKHPGLESEIITKAGFVVEEILLMAEEYKADLIVMGVLGNGKSTSVFGSNTTALMKKAKCPVLAIPAGLAFVKPTKIALACDYSAIVPEHVTDTVKYFVHLLGSKLHVFNVLKRAELVTYQKASAEVNLENSLCDIEHSLHYPSGENLLEETNNFIETNNIGMLVMIPHSYNLISGMFHASSTKKMAFHTKIPLLSIHE
ncbi:MAG TPA: universal stress protein [Bacteroidia bacterium]|jgi:nucleotide-binding universal stress UspA family protein|nr:universal stress protein [Bacteroidia bacterium]